MAAAGGREIYNFTNPMRSLTPSSPRGFNIVEMLVILAALALLAAIGIPALGHNKEVNNITAAQDAARSIASIFSSGRQAGAFADVTSVASAMTAVGQGANGTGSMANLHFRLSGISPTMDSGKPLEQQVQHYLTFANGTLQYSPNGTDTAFWGPWSPASSTCFASQHDAETALDALPHPSPLGQQYRIRSFQESGQTQYFIAIRRLLTEHQR